MNTVAPDLDPPLPAQMICLAYDRGEYPPLSALEEIVRGWDMATTKQEQAGVITIAGLLVSHDPDVLLNWSNYPRELVDCTVSRLIWNGIWTSQGMCVDWPEDEAGYSPMLDGMVGAAILRRTTNQLNEKAEHFYKLTDGKPEPAIRSRNAAATIWMVAKALMNLGYTDVEAVTITHWAWLDVPVPRRYICAGKLAAGPIYYLSRVTRPPVLPEALVADWREKYKVWQYYRESAKFLQGVK